MASSGEFTTNNAFGEGYPGAAKFSWWVNSQSVEGNYTDIGFSITATGGNERWSIYHFSPSLWVEGENFTAGSAQRVQGETYITGTKRIYHNDDGTKSFSASFKTSVYYASGNPASGSGSWSLPTIARKSSPTASASEISIPATSGSITINTNRKSSSFTHTITLKVGSTTIATKTGVGASTSFNLADIDDAILATIPSSTSATVTVDCVTYNGSTNIGSNSTTFTAKVNDGAAPAFSDFTYQDSNSTTTAITGNNQYIIAGKSQLHAKISTSQKATAKYSATMSSYTFAINGASASQAYSTSAIDKNLGTVSLAGNITANTSLDLVVTAIDSRGKKTSKTKGVTVVPYKAPVINATATRLNGFENDTTIKISGAFSPILVNTAKNTVAATGGLQYRYKLASSTTWILDWTNLTATVTPASGTATVPDFILKLDNQQSYTIEIKMTDKLETTTASLTVAVGQPAFYIGADGRVSVGGMPTKSKPSGSTGQLEVTGDIYANGQKLEPFSLDKVFPVGAIFMSVSHTTATAVHNALGGTWEAWGKGRVPVGVNTSETEFNTVEKTGGAKTHTLTTSQIPSHRHDGLFFSTAQVTRDGKSGSGAINMNVPWQNVGDGLKACVGETGGGQAHNNLQPYITCYMYKRTA